MLAKEIVAIQREQPFSGLRIYVSDGAMYEIRHPEMMMVTAARVYIALPPTVNGVPGSSVYCDPVHITRIEPINGRPRPPARKRRK